MNYRQHLGRLFRVGGPPLVIAALSDLGIERAIASRAQSQIIFIGPTTESVGFPIDILPKSDITHKYDFDI